MACNIWLRRDLPDPPRPHTRRTRVRPQSAALSGACSAGRRADITAAEARRLGERATDERPARAVHGHAATAAVGAIGRTGTRATFAHRTGHARPVTPPLQLRRRQRGSLRLRRTRPQRGGLRRHAYRRLRRHGPVAVKGLHLRPRVKVSRADWLRELADPGKAAAFMPTWTGGGLPCPRPDRAQRLTARLGAARGARTRLVAAVPRTATEPGPLPRSPRTAAAGHRHHRAADLAVSANPSKETQRDPVAFFSLPSGSARCPTHPAAKPNPQPSGCARSTRHRSPCGPSQPCPPPTGQIGPAMTDELDQRKTARHDARRPIRPCQSQGGPYDDDAFVAGFHAASRPRAARHSQHRRDSGALPMVRTALYRQLELIAMNRTRSCRPRRARSGRNGARSRSRSNRSESRHDASEPAAHRDDREPVQARILPFPTAPSPTRPATPHTAPTPYAPPHS